MISLIPILQEALAIKDVNMTKGSKPAVCMSGRYQPITKAHAMIIQKMIDDNPDLEPVVFIVKGKGTSEDTDKNPLDFNLQKKLIQKSVPQIGNNIIEVPDAFIGTMVNELRNKDYEMTVFYCGTDRLSTYNDQLKRYSDKLNIDVKIEEIKRTDDDISATKVRDSVKNNDLETFKTMTTNLGKAEFDLLRKKIT